MAVHYSALNERANRPGTVHPVVTMKLILWNVVNFLLLVLAGAPGITSLADRVEQHSLYDVIAFCYTNISQSLVEYQNTDMLELSEPMLAFLKGSYNLWTYEKSLQEETLDFISIRAMFDQNSFNATVLPKLVTHCSIVNQQLLTCLVETVNSTDSPDSEIIIDKINRLSQRYCVGTEPREDIITDLMNLYVTIGALFDMVWPQQGDSAPAQALDRDCGSLSSITDELLQVAHGESCLLKAIATVEEVILTAVRCYATVLNEDVGMSNLTEDVVIELTKHTLAISEQDVDLYQYVRQTPSEPVRQTPSEPAKGDVVVPTTRPPPTDQPNGQAPLIPAYLTFVMLFITSCVAMTIDM